MCVSSVETEHMDRLSIEIKFATQIFGRKSWQRLLMGQIVKTFSKWKPLKSVQIITSQMAKYAF